MKLVQRGSEAPPSAPHLGVGIEVVVWWRIQSLVASASIRSTGCYTAHITITLMVTRLIVTSRCCLPAGC